MKIHNEFDVPLPPVEAWKTLRDIEEIVPCLPGAEITERVDELVSVSYTHLTLPTNREV